MRYSPDQPPPGEFFVKGTSKNSSVRGVSVIDTDNWLSRLTFSAI